MSRRLIAIAAACAWIVGCSGSSSPSNAIPRVGSLPGPVAAPNGNVNELPEPPVVKSVNGTAKLTLDADLNGATGLPGLDYRGQHNVEPTIVVNPGDTIELTLQNNLQPAKGMQNYVNMHFHGLTVSPNPPGDYVLGMYAKPGSKVKFVVHVPANQEPGLYWYHPHVHGIVNYQVGEAGMSGAIVIFGLEQHIPALAQMRQRVIVFRDTGVGANIGPVGGNMDGMDGMDASDDTGNTGSEIARPKTVNNNPCGPDLGLTPSLNFSTAPVITMSPGEQQFFRVINASGHKTLKLAIDGEQLQVVAIDGFAYDTHHGNPAVLTEPYAVVPPAARVEFIATGPKSGHSKLRTLCFDSGPSGDRDPSTVLAQIVPPAAGKPAAYRAPQPLRVGSPLPVNQYTSSLPEIAAKRSVVFSEGPKFFRINGKIFSVKSPPMFTVHAGTTEEWNVSNNTQEVHDFHIHQIHFLVEAINGKNLAHPYWADSIVIPHRLVNGTNGNAKLLMDFQDPIVKGTFVFHCHILDHEDHGMMAKIEAI